jgi:hypothetical protein
VFPIRSGLAGTKFLQCSVSVRFLTAGEGPCLLIHPDCSCHFLRSRRPISRLIWSLGYRNVRIANRQSHHHTRRVSKDLRIQEEYEGIQRGLTRKEIKRVHWRCEKQEPSCVPRVLHQFNEGMSGLRSRVFYPRRDIVSFTWQYCSNDSSYRARPPSDGWLHHGPQPES